MIKKLRKIEKSYGMRIDWEIESEDRILIIIEIIKKEGVIVGDKWVKVFWRNIGEENFKGIDEIKKNGEDLEIKKKFNEVKRNLDGMGIFKLRIKEKRNGGDMRDEILNRKGR